MSSRLDLVLKKFPAHENGIRTLASRDPSGNLKYLDWSARVLASGQALEQEIADVVEMFHRFKGQWFGRLRRDRIRHDLYSYRPQDLANLRDNLIKIRKKTERKRRERERLYRIEGEIESDVVYEDDNLIVRHIKNKQASVHYGLGTKWCISMLREGHFENYESNNATFFFIERKTRIGDEFDKVALMMPRGGEMDGRDVSGASAFTTLDEHIDMIALAKVYGLIVFDIFRHAYCASITHPGSTMFRVLAGTATSEQIEATFNSISSGTLKIDPYETEATLEAICCNDAAPWSVLEKIEVNGEKIATAAWNRMNRQQPRTFRRRRRSRRHPRHGDHHLTRSIFAALAIHPNTPTDDRVRIVKALRRRKVNISAIHRAYHGSRVGIEHRETIQIGRRRGFHHRRARNFPLSELRRRVGMFERMAVRARKALKKKLLEKKQKEKKTAKKKGSK